MYYNSTCPELATRPAFDQLECVGHRYSMMQTAAFIESLGFLGTINEAANVGYLTRNKNSWKQIQKLIIPL